MSKIQRKSQSRQNARRSQSPKHNDSTEDNKGLTIKTPKT